MRMSLTDRRVVSNPLTEIAPKDHFLHLRLSFIAAIIEGFRNIRKIAVSKCKGKLIASEIKTKRCASDRIKMNRNISTKFK